MKKAVRKLSLSRETLRTLETPVLQMPQGGQDKQDLTATNRLLLPTWPTDCDC